MPLVTERRFETWPYIATGLLMIVLFWSRAILHVVTVVRWPLELRHNFLYVAGTFVKALMFASIADPVEWNSLGTFYGVVIWILFRSDVALVRNAAVHSTSSAGRELFAAIERDQFVNIRLVVPGIVATFGAASLVARLAPGWFLASGHVLFAVAQLACSTVYLVSVMRFWSRLAPLISASHEAEE